MLKIVKTKLEKEAKERGKRMRREILILVLILVTALFFSVDVKAYDDNGTYFTCYNCDDCVNALNNNTYSEVKLGADISDYSGTCINNPENFTNKTFDCQGHVIDGDDNGGDGIYLESKGNNIVIKNCVITDFDHGFMLLGVNNVTIENNNVSSCVGDGIAMWSNSQNLLIKNNFIFDNGATGIYVYNCHNNTIFNNTILDNQQRQISLEEGSSFNNISNNSISVINAGENLIYLNRGLNNTISFNYLETISDSNDAIWLDDYSSDNLITRNVLVCNQCDVAGIAVIGSTTTVEQNNITYNDISNFSSGIYYAGTLHYIANNKIYDCGYGIVADYPSEDIFYKNEIFNCDYGIYINSGTGLVVEENELYDNPNNLYLSGLTYSNITKNLLSNGSYGIMFESSNNNNLSSNTIENNVYGVYSSASQDNIIDKNVFGGNNYSVYLFTTTTGVCRGDAVHCNEINNQTACEQQQICSWLNNKCRGIALSCPMFMDQTSCTRQLGCYWQLQASSNYRFNITSNTVDDCEFGFYIMGKMKFAHNHSISDNNISQCNIGIFLDDLRDSSFANLILDNDLDLVSTGRSNFFENVTFKNTKVSFNYSGNINVSHASMQGSAPSGMTYINKFLEVENSSAAQVNITFFYQDSDLVNIKSEESLGLYEYSGSSWEKINYSLNTSSNTLSANLTDFSVFGIFGEEKPSTGGGGGGGGGYTPAVCGDGKCDSRRENYLNCPRDCPPPSEPPENVLQDLGDVGNGTNFEGGFAQVFKFRVKGQEHVAQIVKIEEDSVTLLIWSSPLQVLLYVGQPKQIDLDGNNLAELEILLSKIENGKAFLFLKEIEESMPSAPQKPEEKEVPTEEKKPSLLLPLLLIIIVVAIIIAIIVWQAREKKLRWLGYK